MRKEGEVLLKTQAFDILILIEIAFVLIIMSVVKWAADAVQIIGAGSIAMWAGIIVATLLMKRRGMKWRELGLKLPKGRREWVLDLALSVGCVILVIAFMVLVLAPTMKALGIVSPPESHDRFAFFLGRPIVFISYLVGVVWIGAAMGEELLMRGFLLNRFSDLFGKNKFGWSIALVLHAIIFGSLHAYQGLPGIIGTAVVALIFGGIYLVANRRLFPVIIGHGLLNTISLTAYYISDGAIM